MNPRKGSVCFSTATVKAPDLFSSILQTKAKIGSDHSIVFSCQAIQGINIQGTFRAFASSFKDVIKKRCPASNYKTVLLGICSDLQAAYRCTEVWIQIRQCS